MTASHALPLRSPSNSLGLRTCLFATLVVLLALGGYGAALLLTGSPPPHTSFDAPAQTGVAPSRLDVLPREVVDAADRWPAAE